MEEDDYLILGLGNDEPRFLFNKTTTLGFSYPVRFNKTSVALLSGAILFVLVNTAFLILYINSKLPPSRKKSKPKTKGNNNSNEKKDNDKDNESIYDDYYIYYYDDFYDDDLSRIDEIPR